MPNSSGKQTPVICWTCSKVFSSPRNLRRHEQNIHKIFAAPPPPTKCDECRESFSSLAEAREHVELAHNVSTDSLCIYCHTIFLSVEKFRQHMSKNHQLPIWTPGNEVRTSSVPTESAFRGKLRRYELSVKEDELDLMNVIMRNKEEIDALIDERVQEGPCKFQLHVDVSMIKFSSDTNETGDGELRQKKTMLYLNSKMINVFFNGIEKETYLEMIEHMVNAINTFASHGSGWIVERIEKLAVSFAAFSPIRAGSYIDLPDSLKPVKQSFTNIKTRNDQKCFLYCFVAAYHDRYSETTTALYPAAQSYQHRNKLKNYKLSQEHVVKNEGWYEMPMGLYDIDRFEQLNNCQVNVFR